jgi:hypothetical protein
MQLKSKNNNSNMASASGVGLDNSNPTRNQRASSLRVTDAAGVD